jgi:murein DD-endopeptidase MepM/ murein hydrolase activator NlpD
VKKIGVTFLVWTFKGLIGLKKCLTLLLLMVKKPFFWLCRAIFFPTLALGYRMYRYIRKGVSRLTAPIRERAMSLIANRYAIHATVILLVFLVTATNIYANDSVAPMENPEDRSILASLSEGEDEEIFLEEAVTSDAPLQENVSYLGEQALSAHDYVGDEQYDGRDDGAYDDSEEESIFSSVVNAVHVQPDPEGVGAPSTRTQIEEYVVQDGDTVGSIARQFGITSSTVLAANGLTSRGVIRPGQKLRILPFDGVMYVIKRGDTLAKIAGIYGSDAQKILEANGLADASDLAVGVELILPDGRAPAPKPPTRIAGTIKDVFVPPAASDRVGTGKMLWPTAARRITQYYKVRHTGVDIAGPVGTAIYAADDGTVIFSGWNRGGYGNMVIVDHGGGLFTRYAHASKTLVKVGDAVKRGDVIQLMGSTGRSTGPHLHFEVMIGSTSRRTNPFDYVR